MSGHVSAAGGGWANDEATTAAVEADFVRQVEGFSSFHDADELADVDAAFRSQRRIAVAYFAVFVTGIAGAAAVTTSSRWAVADRVLGGFSPSFLIAAVAIYVFVVVLGLAAATLANGVDDRMLGPGLTPASPLTPRARSLPAHGSYDDAYDDGDLIGPVVADLAITGEIPAVGHHGIVEENSADGKP